VRERKSAPNKKAAEMTTLDMAKLLPHLANGGDLRVGASDKERLLLLSI
jgi:hypothetical protein